MRHGIVMILGGVVLGILLAVGSVCTGKMPTVEYDGATGNPVRCIEIDSDGVEIATSPANPRCKEIIAGRHEAAYISPRGW